MHTSASARPHRSIFERLDMPVSSGMSPPAATSTLKSSSQRRRSRSPTRVVSLRTSKAQNALYPQTADTHSPLTHQRVVDASARLTSSHASHAAPGRFVYEAAVASIRKENLIRPNTAIANRRIAISTGEPDRSYVAASQAYIRNLPHDVSTATLERLFRRAGQIVSLKIERGPLTTAQVGFMLKEAAERCVAEYDGFNLEGYRLKVAVVNDSSQPGNQRVGSTEDTMPYHAGSRIISSDAPFLPSAIPRPSIFDRIS